MKRLLFILIVLIFIPHNVQALENNDAVAQNSQLESLYNYVTEIKSKYEILDDVSPHEYIKSYMKTGDGNFSLKKLLKAAVLYVFKEVALSMKTMISIIIIAIVCALLKNLENAFSNESLTNIAYFACYSLIIIIILKSFNVSVKLVVETINMMSDFMMIVVPIMLTFLAGAGGFVEAGIMDPLLITVINLSSRIFLNIIIPLILIGLALKFVNNISSDYKINNLTNLINKVVTWGEGIVMTIFVGVLVVRGFTTKTIDVVSAKTAKYAVDNFVPIIGKCLSDAISTVAGYSLLLKNAVGSLGLIIVICIVAVPIIKIFIIALIYKLTAALVEPVSEKRIVNCIDGAGDSLVVLGSILICVSIMFFIMISVISTAGVGTIGG